MRKRGKQVLTLMLAVMTLCACQPENKNTNSNVNKKPKDYKEKLAEKYDFTKASTFQMKNFFDYMPRASVIGVKNGTFMEIPEKDGYFVMQGGCSDGTYIYVILENRNVIVNGKVTSAHKIFKIDMNTWEIVAESGQLPLGHGNSMTYNNKSHQLIVSNYSPDPKEITFVNPDSLTITGNKILSQNITGIAYNEAHDQYVLANGAAQFSIVDADFNELIYVEGHSIGLGTQDIDCDDNYIYMGNSGVVSNPGVEAVKVYDWDGEYKGVYRVDSVNEQEAVFNANGKYYITFYTGNGGRIFEIQYDFSLLED